MKGFEFTSAPEADVLDVAKAIVKILDMPFGTRPFRVNIEPAQDGAEIVNDCYSYVHVAELGRPDRYAPGRRGRTARSRL